ncbi:stage II sporulation protein M [Halobacillus salinarum]|uniref:Stage II sporulation protein M n=1 Tax=Halobacillus salinarum TaxID=2932257 RepID=A0ABY4EMF2_9BACI|nr:stage II sporulation protein M [Halobacillus salinarum]UOQ45033.1 stage II sporulation protein M [Halobacillus salinarum]
MNYQQFIKSHRQDWKRLEEILHKLDKNTKRLSPHEVEEFQMLYQKAAQHLAYTQTYFPEEDVADYLNDLAAKAHNLFYKDQISSLSQIKAFFGSRFIQLLTEQWKFVIAAMLLFLIGAVGAFLSVWGDPLHFYAVLPESMANAIDPDRLGEGHDQVNSPVMSASIMTNNIQVALLAFAGGVTFGLLSVYLLLYNGIIIGAVAAFFLHYGKFYEFWAYIVPHGIIELTAIFIAGGAGLMMGYKLFVPGETSRIYQLKSQAFRSVQLLLGTLPLFVIAGIIEGFITPSPLPLSGKYAFSIVTLLGLAVYVGVGKRMYRKKRKLNQPAV